MEQRTFQEHNKNNNKKLPGSLVWTYIIAPLWTDFKIYQDSKATNQNPEFQKVTLNTEFKTHWSQFLNTLPPDFMYVYLEQANPLFALFNADQYLSAGNLKLTTTTELSETFVK